MKKIIWFSLGVFAAFSIVIAGAASAAFIDAADFANWFEPAVRKMDANDIMKGYPDGSFGPAETVNRAELATILDKFAANVVGQELRSEPAFCTAEAVAGLTVFVYDKDGEPLTDAEISIQGSSTILFDNLNNGQYAGLYESSGYHTFIVKKYKHVDYVETIKLERDACHVIPQTRTIMLIRR